MIIEKGGIYLAALEPAGQHGTYRKRPVLVVSNDTGNSFSSTATILPIVSDSLEKVYPFEVGLQKGAGNLPKDSKAKADQIQTLNQNRLVESIGILSDEDMALVENAVKIHLDIS